MARNDSRGRYDRETIGRWEGEPINGLKRRDPDVEAMYAALNAKRARRTDAAIRELAYNCAGIGAAAIMDQAPNAIMSTEAITAAVDALLAAKVGIDPLAPGTVEGACGGQDGE